MTAQKANRKGKAESTDSDRLNRGDMQRKHKKEPRPPQPSDRGDVKVRNKKLSKQEIFKTTKPKKAKSLKIPADLVSRSTNTFAESVPLSFENPFKINMDFSPDRSGDYRKRVKDRYTFRRCQNGAEIPEMRSRIRKDDEVRKVNYALQYDTKHELPKQTHFESLERTKESHEVKKSERIKDRDSVHKDTSVAKLKPIIKTRNDSVDRKTDAEAEKMKGKNVSRLKPLIKTITSKVDTRVYKAVTFVEMRQRKPLQIKIPKDISQKRKAPSKSRIPRLVNSSMPKPEIPLNQMKRRGNEGLRRRTKRKDTRKTPSNKSVDSMPTEVAKWVPESINKHTMPYYEAWVNKTLTAISKYSKTDKAYLEKSKVLKALKDMEMRQNSPELVYEKLKDENYAGRIRVHKSQKKM